MSEIYNRIRMRRQELGWTTDELAKRMGYKDRSSISKIESGKADIPQSKVKAFADVLDTSVSWLLGIDEANNTSDKTDADPHPLPGFQPTAGDGHGPIGGAGSPAVRRSRRNRTWSA